MTGHKHDEVSHQRNWNGLAKIGILAGLGLYFTFVIFSGNLDNYINARFAWLSYLAAVLFYALALMALIRWLGDHDHADEGHHHDHDHSETSWKVLLIVAFPLIIGTLIPSQPLGAEAINGDVRLSSIPVTNASVIDSDPLARNILDWLRLFNTSGNLRAFNGQDLSVIGFVYREPDFPENYFMVVRFTISCCVADSSAIGLPVFVNGISTDDIADGEWVRVEGRFEVGDFQGQTLPIIHLDDITPVAQPDNPYLNP